MKVAEIKELTDADLIEKIQTEKAQYHQMKLNHAVSPLENNSQIKAARRNSARMKTEHREMQA